MDPRRNSTFHRFSRRPNKKRVRIEEPAPWNFYRLGPGLTLSRAGRGFCAVQKMALVCRGAVPGETAVDYLRYCAGAGDYILPRSGQ